jgi:predicted small secreted protein
VTLPGLTLSPDIEIRETPSAPELRRGWNDLRSPRISIGSLPMESIMRKLIGYSLIAGMLVLSACNTVKGVGRDVQSAGDAVEKTAD